MIVCFTILLSTYNGELFLEKFLNSLADQDYGEFHVIVRDDGSTDGTLNIINRWEKEGLIDIRPHFGNNIGWRDSFNLLLHSSDGSYFVFADQDDVWCSNKLSTLANYINLNNISVSKKCLIVHNANVIDSNDLVLKYNVLLGYKSFGNIKNRVSYMSGGLYGCTICFTNALRDATACLEPHGFIAHDHKCLIIAGYHGEIYHIDTPLINWRRHNNSSTVKGLIIYYQKFTAIINLSVVEARFSFSSRNLLVLKKIYFLFLNYFIK